MNRRLLFLWLMGLCLSLIACQQTVSPTPTATMLPTATAVAPTSTSQPSSTPTNNPTIQPTSIPTSTPTPTATPPPSYPTYNGPPLDRREIGVQVHIHQENYDELFDHLTALNVGWVKTQVSWKLYQPEPNRYDDFRFEELDRFIAYANDRDIAVLVSVSKAPEWSRPTTEMDGPPSNYALYGEFMTHLARRYVGQVAAYELWNEPNLQREWNGVPLSAADLVALIREGATAVAQTDPSAIIISAPPATTGINDGLIAIDDREFLRQMLDAGVGDFVSAIGVHPYGWANPPDSTWQNPPTAVAPTHNNHPSFFFTDTLNDYHALLQEFGVDKPLWVTEFGWGSFDQFDKSAPEGVEFMNNVTEWQQAEYTLRAYELAHNWDWVGPLILWNLNFGPLLGTDFSETGFSILRPDGTPRPIYKALQTIAQD